jgi:three-Cys-motif partner protein
MTINHISTLNPYAAPIDDGLALRKSGAWVAEKLHYIRRYLEIVSASMGTKNWRNIRYIDLFAGPGKCIIRDTNEILLGSALIATTRTPSFTDYVFVDLSTENLAALQQRCASIDGVSQRCEYRVGDSNQVVNDLVREIQARDQQYVRGSWCSLNVALLDPEGLELAWSTVEALSQVNKMDLIIHYSQFGITRNLENLYTHDSETAIDRFFGDSHWRTIYKTESTRGTKSGTIHRLLIEHYKQKLAQLGYHVRDNGGSIDTEPLMRSSHRNAPLYRLLFASKHPLGNKFWKESTKVNSLGQGSLFG